MDWIDKNNFCILRSSFILIFFLVSYCFNCIEDRYGFFE